MAAIRFSRSTIAAVAALALGALVIVWLLLPRGDPAGGNRSAEELLRSGASACEAIQFEGSRFTACRYRAGDDRLELILDPGGQPLRSFAALDQHLGSRTEELRFAMNAGMYNEAGQPIGLYMEDGRERRPLNRRDGPGNFHLQPNGVFAVDTVGRVSVVRSDAFRPGPETVWATQSGPMLVIDGALHPRISDNGTSLNVRNGVGVSAPDTAWFVISDEPVSFGRFARLFRDRLGCRNALFLDGTVSSLWDRPAARMDAYSSLGPIVAVFRSR
jgi:uncharacterized protein YigE (DUF2233 family)